LVVDVLLGTFSMAFPEVSEALVVAEVMQSTVVQFNVSFSVDSGCVLVLPSRFLDELRIDLIHISGDSRSVQNLYLTVF
jgi:hypothetical protein